MILVLRFAAASLIEIVIYRATLFVTHLMPRTIDLSTLKFSLWA